MIRNGSAPSNRIQEQEANDAELATALEAYLAAVEAGRPVDLDDLAARHPAVADQLRSCLAVLRLAGEVERDPGSGPDEDRGDQQFPVVLGDFRLICPVGRGGMGIVYEAEQLSLRRRVALKVLPFAAALDPLQLRRFQTEAQAAAQLHHTNIVPVFAVGCERGVNFYAMQFIEGQTLASLIRDLRGLGRIEPSRDGPATASTRLAAELASGHLAPASQDASPATSEPASGRSSPSTLGRAYFRTIAGLGMQAAEALDHAHALGIIHRDIKPANLLIDVRGNLWVTDFGLARLLADSNLTRTGDVLGTLRYMSPEQALGHPAVIDPRSDIYSLGATLYELLTLRPAVTGRDRQEVLRRIAFDDPKPPRQINAAIPRELETIVLKALAKEPTGRYATARDLADDLRRFLDCKPILARRPTLRDRCVKWVRRHPTFFIAALAFLALGTLVLGAATLMVWDEKGRAQQAYLAEVQLRRKARKAVDEMYSQVVEQLFTQKPDLDKVRRQFLENALTHYREFALQDDALPSERYEVVRVYQRIGDIERKLNDGPEAERAYGRAIEVLEGLVRAHPRDPALINQLVYVHNCLAFILSDSGRLAEAERMFRRELSIAEELASDFPDEAKYQRRVGWVCENLATLLFKLHRYDEGGELCRRNQEILEPLAERFPKETSDRANLAISYNNLAIVWCKVGRFDRAVTLFEKARDMNSQLMAQAPEHPGYGDDLYKNYSNLGELYFQIGDLRQAEMNLRQSDSLLEKCRREFPNVPAFRGAYTHLFNLGDVLFAQGSLKEAEPYFRRALGVIEKESADHPSYVDLLPGVADSHTRLADLLWVQRKRDEAREHYLRARTVWEQMARRSPRSPEWRTGLAQLLANCPELSLRDPARAVDLAREAIDGEPEGPNAGAAMGVALYRRGEAQAAIEALKRSTEKTSGGSVTTWFFLAMAHGKSGNRDEATRWFEKAATWTQQRRPNDPELRLLRDEAAALLGLPIEPKPADREDRDPKTSR